MSKSGKLSTGTCSFSLGSFKRPFGNKPPRRYFLIICEGIETEPNYFEEIRKILPPEMVDHITIDGAGRNTLSLVARAEKIVEERRQSASPNYYHIWVVFDRDSFAPSDFDNAIKSIESKTTGAEQWHAAWSNEAFELWYILHFKDQCGGKLSRKVYQDILEEEMERPYQKNAKDMFKIIRSYTPKAIERAKTALRLQSTQRAYHDMNPATTVHLLVEELLAYI